VVDSVRGNAAGDASLRAIAWAGVESTAAAVRGGGDCTSGPGKGAAGLAEAVGTDAGGAASFGVLGGGAEGVSGALAVDGGVSATNCLVITCPL